MKTQIHLDIEIKSKKWQAIKNADKLVEEICLELIPQTELAKYLKIKSNQLEIAVSLVSDLQIKKINNEFRGKDKATDVLSFPFTDKNALKNAQGPIFLGDIVLAFETINNEANLAKKDFKTHLTHLILHSILHLLGYDHENESDAEVMENLEIAILKKLGIGNPYM